MEFINPYKRYSEDVKQLCHFEDAEALNNEFSSTELSNWVHTSDNSFIDTSFGRTCKQHHESHYQLIGIFVLLYLQMEKTISGVIPVKS